ncbi:hypothetical protein OSTOST_19100 [Ostertagia ostertagi]
MVMSRLNMLVILLIFAYVAYAAQPTSLDEKVKALQDLLYRQPAVRLNMDRWKTFVRQQPRNYSMFVMFTALSPGVNCPICKPAYDEFMIMANS